MKTECSGSSYAAIFFIFYLKKAIHLTNLSSSFFFKSLNEDVFMDGCVYPDVMFTA